MKILYVFFSLVIVSACSRPAGQESKLSIQIPNSSVIASSTKYRQNDQVSKMAATYDQMCFAANITASDIPSTKPSSCDVSLGAFAGPVAQNTVLVVNGIPQGKARRLQIFAFLKKSSADSCPNFTAGFDQFDRSRIYVLGEVPSFDILSDTVNVSVDLNLPDPSLTLQALNSFADSCKFQPTPVPAALAGIGAGASLSSGGPFVMKSQIRQVDNMTKISGGSFVIRMGKIQ